MRGVTIGPIESSLQPGRGYGSPAYERTLTLIERMGGNWISLTPFGRIWDLSPTGVDRSFEQPAAQTELAIRRSVEQAHAHGLKVLLVPHLWAETGVWRGQIDPPSEQGWQRWADGYQQFLLSWAKVAAKSGVGMRVDISLVPQRAHAMSPYEVMLSESQERMLVIPRPGRERDVERIFERWELHGTRIGEVTTEPALLIYDAGDLVAALPPRSLADDAPEYDISDLARSKKGRRLCRRLAADPDLSPAAEEEPKAKNRGHREDGGNGTAWRAQALSIIEVSGAGRNS
jgi:hypothetical protein